MKKYSLITKTASARMTYRYLIWVACQLPILAFGQKLWQRVPLPSGANSARVSSDSAYNYGSEGLPSPRTDMISWSDPTGGVWIYGGIGYDENTQWGIFSDLWKYSTPENKWILVWGERNKASDLEKQLPDGPMPRKEASAWVDSNGKLWLFGGRQFNELFHLDDLWVFDPSTSKWARHTGTGKFNEKPSRGVIKQASKQFSPGSRSLASSWVDKKGNLWLFGGLSYTPGQQVIAELYSDLWMYDTKKEEWQWVSGKDKPNQPHKYEFKNQASKENVPTPRAASARWYDQSTDKLFLYGGIGSDSSAMAIGGLSDMWVYDINKDQWGRLSGDSKVNVENNASNPNREDKANSPGFRISSMFWKGPDAKLYLAGGHSSFTAEQIYIEKNVWAFSPKSGLWQVIPQAETTVSGSGAPFTDAKGDLYIFGGKEFDRANLLTRPSNSIYKLSF